MLVLASDIGGTHARFAIVDAGSSAVRVRFQRTYATASYPRFEPALDAFLKDARAALGAGIAVSRAAVAIAGPVQGQEAQLTHLPSWRVDQHAVESALGAQTRLMNDFEALAFGVAGASAEDSIVLQRGVRAPEGTVAVVGAGTGLGVAALLWDGHARRPLATEAGHVGFAPQNETQLDLWRHLNSRHGRVSAERVVSGPGLAAIYAYLRSRSPQAAEEPIGDPAAISSRALAEPSSLAARALDLFVACYGTFTGDVALAFLARGGVYVCGGIAAKLAGRFQAGDFLAAFSAKGRHSGLAVSIPVFLVVNQSLGLLGAARSVADRD
ncbi:MAG: glucokinase [Burkholderiales bacterium]